MAGHSRYDVGEDEAGGVLKNKLRIGDQKNLDDLETVLFKDAYTHFFELFEDGKLNLNIKLIFDIHRYFLSTLYEWAGMTRKVELSKGGIMFCPHSQIEKQLKIFEKTFKKNLPSASNDKKTTSLKLAILHCEFNAIHPFREGNGRTMRLFLDLVAASAGSRAIGWGKSSKASYVKACIAGMHGDYSKMQQIIYKGIT